MSSSIPVTYDPPQKIRSYINGQFVDPSDGAWLDNFEPATGTVYSQVADSSHDDVAVAVQAAEGAFADWSKLSLDDRAGILNRIGEGISARVDELSQAESMDNGKPVWLARNFEIPRASQNFRFFAGLIMGSSSSAFDSPVGLNVTLTQPWGVVGTISPWNLPLYLFTWKVAPALAAGNCVVAKPSELTPLTAMLLGEICTSAGLPPGVLNIVQGSGAKTGQAIVDHPKIHAISFTGGTATGARIAAAAAPKFKKLSLELGGKNPNLIFADCDFEKMMATTLRSSFQNQGQICLCGSRILVEASIAERFTSEFVKRTKAMTVGDPRDPTSQLGAVVSLGHFEKILGAIEGAHRNGGRLLCGGTAAKVPGRCAEGWFVLPTVLDGMDSSCSTNQEEIFGPVVTIQTFRDETQALELANDSRYGLSSTIWTTNLDRALRLGRGLHTGVVWINGWLIRDLRTPFGGMKQSGVGREGGWDAIDFWLQKKNVMFCGI